MELIAIRPTNTSLVITIYLLLHLLAVLETDSQPVYLYSSCEKDTVDPTGKYSTNLKNLLNSLSSKANTNYPPGGFYSISLGTTTSETVYGLFLCRGDQNPTSCGDCVTNAAIDDLPVVYCPGSQQAVIWYDECMLRYSNETLIGELATQPSGYIVGSDSGQGDPTVYANAMFRTMNDMVDDTANNKSGKKYATKMVMVTSTIPLYVLQQCTPDLTPGDCKRCLKFAIDQLALFSSSRSFTPSCNVRYESFPFYVGAVNFSSTPASGESRGKKNHLILIVAILTAISMSTLVLSFGSYIYKRKRKVTEAYKAEIKDINTMESLQFNLSTIRVATHNFSSDCRLGGGGFGEVYKGKLNNGQDIAVKRLSKDSRQGVTEFKTEVVLVAKLQHKNLVKLLGFCVDSTEKILVYEFLANSSLDQFLFDVTKKTFLDWQTRFKIILGVARGLMYLHEDSRLKIIHRDLKPSNILLDEHMNPKISDFGLAKHFGVEETQGNTKRIVGTYGYMAPEYAITGHYSVKSDVYSFGIIILEIVSGQQNRFFCRPRFEEALLHRAWRLWNEHKALDLVDLTLNDNFSKEEVEKCIQIGLLCVQGEPIDRPRMMTVVGALTGQSISISMPKLPHFFGTNSIIDEDGEITVTPSNIYTGTEMITDVYSRE